MESYKVSSVQDMKNLIATNSDFQQAIQADPEKAVQKIEDNSPVPNNFIYRVVVGSLGLVIVIIALGIISRLVYKNDVTDANIPNILTALGSAAVGALAGLLAPSPAQPKTQGGS